jgi:predicted P-loop ATPase
MNSINDSKATVWSDAELQASLDARNEEAKAEAVALKLVRAEREEPAPPTAVTVPKRVKKPAIAPPAAHGAWNALALTKKQGIPVADLYNAVFVLTHAPELNGAICTNTLTGDLQFCKDVDFSDIGSPLKFAAGTKIQTEQTLQIRSLLNYTLRVDFGTQLIADALIVVGCENGINPIQAYLETCVWDGVPRIDQWLQTYMHAEDNLYTRAVGSKWLMQAVARAYEPGCDADSMLCLDGEQEVGKNAIMAALSPDKTWLVTLHSGDIDKDMTVSMEGKWIAEFAEMEITRKATMNKLKAFITQKIDTYRKSHRRDHVDHARSNVLWGGSNEETYLLDDTGNRRFWPIRVSGFVDTGAGEPKLDRDGVVRDRDQLWGEAVSRCRSGASRLLTTAENVLAKAEQGERLIADDWDDIVADFIKDMDTVSVPGVMKFALGIADKDLGGGQSKRIVRILKRIGYVQMKRTRESQGRLWVRKIVP